MKSIKLILFFILVSNFSFSQETLQIYFTRLGSFKKYEVHINEVLQYKLKGQRKFNSGKIMAMGDSTIVFDDNREVKLSELKCVRFKKNNILISAFQKRFIIAGIGFFILDTGNNLILDRTNVVNKKAVIISAALFATGLLLKRFEYKKVRIGKNKTLRIATCNYQNLKAPSN